MFEMCKSAICLERVRCVLITYAGRAFAKDVAFSDPIHPYPLATSGSQPLRACHRHPPAHQGVCSLLGRGACRGCHSLRDTRTLQSRRSNPSLQPGPRRRQGLSPPACIYLPLSILPSFPPPTCHRLATDRSLAPTDKVCLRPPAGGRIPEILCGILLPKTTFAFRDTFLAAKCQNVVFESRKAFFFGGKMSKRQNNLQTHTARVGGGGLGGTSSGGDAGPEPAGQQRRNRKAASK